MKGNLKLTIILLFSTGCLCSFILLAFLTNNYEFLAYAAVAFFLILLLARYYNRLRLPFWVVFGLTFVGLMHVLGGNLFIDGVRLYHTWLIQDIFKYDNLVHFLIAFFTVFAAYNLLYPHLEKRLKQNMLLFSILLVLITLGTCAFLEILESIAVIFFNASERVGNYMNNAIDTMFNLFGALSACFFLILNTKRPKDKVSKKN
jgi:uncharacterized membrane protein YjdF